MVEEGREREKKDLNLGLEATALEKKLCPSLKPQDEPEPRRRETSRKEGGEYRESNVQSLFKNGTDPMPLNKG